MNYKQTKPVEISACGVTYSVYDVTHNDKVYTIWESDNSVDIIVKGDTMINEPITVSKHPNITKQKFIEKLIKKAIIRDL